MTRAETIRLIKDQLNKKGGVVKGARHYGRVELAQLVTALFPDTPTVPSDFHIYETKSGVEYEPEHD